MRTENYRSLIKKIKECLNKWRDKSCSQIEKFNIVKMLILSKWIYRVNTIPIKISANICVEIYKLILKHIQKGKELK